MVQKKNILNVFFTTTNLMIFQNVIFVYIVTCFFKDMNQIVLKCLLPFMIVNVLIDCEMI